MKKMFLILASAVVSLTACSKDSEGDDSPPIEKQPFNAVIKDGFKDENGVDLLPPRNIGNIKVGDYIPYNVTITDEVAEQEGETYRVVASTYDEGTHQERSVSYDIYLADKEDPTKMVLLQNPEQLTFNKRGTYSFFIYPKEAGTYNLRFLLEKSVNNQKIGTSAIPIVTFNAVRITAYSHGYFTGKWKWEMSDSFIPIPEQHSVNRRKFFFKIDDGSTEKDKYFQPDKAEIFYFTEYNGDNRGPLSFTVGAEYEYYPEQERIGGIPDLPSSKMNIFIQIKRNGEDTETVKYYNVDIENRQ